MSSSLSGYLPEAGSRYKSTTDVSQYWKCSYFQRTHYLFSADIMELKQLQSETFGGSYPFKPNFMSIGGLQGHYVDESPALDPAKGTIVLLHGNPTWSYLYRNFIPPLVDAGYRCVAPDQIGYGKSEKLAERDDYLLEKRIERFSDFMSQLEFDKATLVLQDWGGLWVWAGR